jgi:hypothetical protein
VLARAEIKSMFAPNSSLKRTVHKCHAHESVKALPRTYKCCDLLVTFWCLRLAQGMHSEVRRRGVTVYRRDWHAGAHKAAPYSSSGVGSTCRPSKKKKKETDTHVREKPNSWHFCPFNKFDFIIHACCLNNMLWIKSPAKKQSTRNNTMRLGLHAW